jgi:hypothetical protein
MILSTIISSSFTPPTYKRIAGTTAEEGVPAQKRVLIYNRADMEYVTGKLSEPDGTWEIGGLQNYPVGTEFLVVSLDDTGTYNAECADKIQPVI